MEYEIKGWSGYYLYIAENEICVYSSWGFDKGRPSKEKSRPSIIIDGKRRKLSQRIGINGYLRIDLNNGVRGKKQLFLHRIIAETLIPNPDNLECIDHIDGNKLNNYPSNLQWITRGDNVRKAQSMGKWGTHPKRYEIKFKCGSKIQIENISKFSRENNYAATKLVAISRGRLKKHKNVIGVVEIT